MTDDKKHKAADPAPTPVDMAVERVRRLSDDVSMQSLNELRELRDQIDAVMRAITERRDDIAARIQRQADVVANVAALKSIVVENLHKLQLQIQTEEPEISANEVRKRLNLPPMPDAQNLK